MRKQIILLSLFLVVVVVSGNSGYFLSSLSNNITQILMYIYGNLNSPPKDQLLSETAKRKISSSFCCFCLSLFFCFHLKRTQKEAVKVIFQSVGKNPELVWGKVHFPTLGCTRSFSNVKPIHVTKLFFKLFWHFLTSVCAQNIEMNVS